MSLPNEIISHIIEYLTYTEFKSFIFANKNFYELSRYITKYYKCGKEKLLSDIMESLHAFKTVYYTRKVKYTEITFDFACQNYFVDVAKFLIDKVGEKTIINQVNSKYIYQDIKLVKVFVEHGINIKEIINEYGKSLLKYLCRFANLEVIKYFAKNSNILDNINIMNTIVIQLLFLEIDRYVYFENPEYKEICLFLLENGAVLTKFEFCHIRIEIENNNLFCIEIFLKYKLIDNINMCLELACFYKLLEMVELFVKYGAVSRPGFYDLIEKEYFDTVRLIKRQKIDLHFMSDEEKFDLLKNSESNVFNYYVYYYNFGDRFYDLVDFAWQHKKVDMVYRLFKHRSLPSHVLINAIKNNYEDFINFFKDSFNVDDCGCEYLKIAFKYKRFNILNIIKNSLDADNEFGEWCDHNKHLKVVKYLKKLN